ncbi:glycosyltransferase family 2 protein [Brachymonas sp. M4Q-1]|uniref:glycosyltransferase family 2 protein n=1 Tax=Brachymonas sp. M4Q-1 TaxID=3416906 RepID=UPI003CEE1AE9
MNITELQCASKEVIVLLATFNGEKFIEAQLQSIVDQNYQNFSVLIHDDGSSDGTREIILNFVKRYPELFFLIEDGLVFGSAKNNFSHLLGLASSLNAKYFMFCDQDDVWHRDKISQSLLSMRVIEGVDEKTPCLVCTDLNLMDGEGNIFADSFWNYQQMECKKDFKTLVNKSYYPGCSMMINKALLNFAGCIPDEAIMHDYWILLVASAFGRISVIDAPLISYRIHGGNLVGINGYQKNFQKILKILEYFKNQRMMGKKQFDQAYAFWRIYHDKLPMEIDGFLRNYLKIRLSGNFILKIKNHRLLYAEGLIKSINKLILWDSLLCKDVYADVVLY